MPCPEGLGDCPLGAGSVLVPFQRKASSMFLSVFSGFNTNKVTEGEANSTFPNSAKNVVKLPRMSEIPPHPTYVSLFWPDTGRSSLASICETVQSSAPIVVCLCQPPDLVLPVSLSTCSTRFFSHPVLVTWCPTREAQLALRDDTKLLTTPKEGCMRWSIPSLYTHPVSHWSGIWPKRALTYLWSRKVTTVLTNSVDETLFQSHYSFMNCSPTAKSGCAVVLCR